MPALLFFQLPEPPEDFRQLGKSGDGAQPFAAVEGRRAGHHCPLFDIAADSTLCIDYGIVMNCEVPAHANLSGKKHVLAQHGASRQTGLRADDIVLANHTSMADLNQAVDLGSSLDARLADSGAIDGGKRLHFHIVFNNGDAGLDDFEVRALSCFCETETIAAHHDAGLQDD